jgi:CRP-like cAMP-binding protein
MISDLVATMRRDVLLSDEEATLVLSFFKERRYKRGAVLLHCGQVAHEVFFVLKGVLHQYYIDESGNERTCNFCFEQDFITDLESFSQQTQSASSIKVLTEVTCLTIRCTDLVALMKQSPAMAEYFRILIERVASRSIKRTKSLLSFSPEQQFLDLLQEQPEVFQKVPQRYIAQYLGIAPESLSRIKKRILAAAKS